MGGYVRIDRSRDRVLDGQWVFGIGNSEGRVNVLLSQLFFKLGARENDESVYKRSWICEDWIY